MEGLHQNSPPPPYSACFQEGNHEETAVADFASQQTERKLAIGTITDADVNTAVCGVPLCEDRSKPSVATDAEINKSKDLSRADTTLGGRDTLSPSRDDPISGLATRDVHRAASLISVADGTYPDLKSSPLPSQSSEHDIEDLLHGASERPGFSSSVSPPPLDQKGNNPKETPEQTSSRAVMESAVSCIEDGKGVTGFARVEKTIKDHAEIVRAKSHYLSSSFPPGPESRQQVQSRDPILPPPHHELPVARPQPRDNIQVCYTAAYLQKSATDSQTTDILSENYGRVKAPPEYFGHPWASRSRPWRHSYGSMYRDQAVQTGDTSDGEELFSDEFSPLLQSKRRQYKDRDGEDAVNPKKEEASFSLCTLLRRLAPITLLMLLHGTSSAIGTSMLTQYIYYRYAEDYDANSTERPSPGASQCSDNGSVQLTPTQVRVQQSTNELLLQMSWTCGFPAIIATILIGTYADQLGRRAILLAMLCGRLARDSVICAVVYWGLDVRFLLLAYFIDGMSGSFFSFYLANYAYTSDVSPDKRTRMIAMTISSSTLGVATAAVSYGAGYIIEDFGFLLSALLVVVTNFLSFPIVICWLENTVQTQGFVCIAPWKAVSKVFKFYVVAVPGRHRGLFWLGAGTFTLLVLDAMGSPDMLYMMAPPFCWDAEQIGLYSAIKDLSVFILSVVLVRLMQLCCRDETLALMGLMTTAAKNVITGLASSSLMLYLAGASGLCSGLSFPVVRGVMSCMVEPDELGALFASLAVIEAAGFLGASTIANKVYQATLEVMRGAVYFVKAGFDIMALFLMIMLVCIMDRRRRATLTKSISVQE